MTVFREGEQVMHHGLAPVLKVVSVKGDRVWCQPFREKGTKGVKEYPASELTRYKHPGPLPVGS